jgi:hypothetical protein
MLQKLLPTQLVAPAAAAADHVDQFAGAKAELEALFSRRALALERRREREEAEMAADPVRARAEACAEFEARLARAIENSKYQDVPKSGEIFSDPTGSDERDRSVAHPEPSPVAAGGSEHPVLIEPPEVCRTTPQTPPAPRRSMDEINSEPPPDHYLKRPDGEWRQFIGPDGRKLLISFARPTVQVLCSAGARLTTRPIGCSSACVCLMPRFTRQEHAPRIRTGESSGAR